jgi:ribosomal peptide maturation radical SAM protein 1
MNISLISMPWPLFNRPSIQLGTLKAYLETNGDWLMVNTKHPYLEVASILGTELYHWISQNVWVSEALYAPLLFPEQRKSSEALAKNYAKKADSNIKKSFNFNDIHENLKSQLENWVSRCDWSRYKIIGFSVCFNSLLASLAAAKSIKKKHPHITIVFGGSLCAAAAGRSILDVFNFVDFVIQGEGEKGLLELCEFISGRHDKLPLNIFSTTSDQHQFELVDQAVNHQLPSLDALPVPDYNDYFSDKKKWFPDKPFIPVLPVEFSRGCWWNKCTFCNLNLQWFKYRYKKSSQMVDEIKALSTKYGCLDFTFTDNMIPPQESLHFFSQTNELNSDLSFFAEIRSLNEKKSIGDIFSLYRRGGLSTIQVGIESLSNSLLKRMRKGTSVIENIATMRAAQEHSLELEGNLIIQFPGSTQSEVDETLENLDFVFSYSPLTSAAFFLGHDSPVYISPKKFGIKAIVNHANNTKIFPREILGKLNLIVHDYRGDRTVQKKIWHPVFSKIEKWQKYHEKRALSALHKPLLYYRDGGDFLLIRQELINGMVLNHRLKGASRQIYLFCTHIRTDNELFEEFPTIPQEKILTFLDDLAQKRLIFSDNNRYLALAVHNTSKISTVAKN